MDDHSTLPGAVLALYDLGETHAVEPKTGGWIDRSFLIASDRGRYFFKRRSPAITR